MPKVSIIIPIYNVEKYLRQCLDSVINQTLADIEIICIDDGGKDNCPQIIDEYANKDNRIIAVHKENGGYASAVNYGLKIAQGEYIGIVESDDWIAHDMYEKLYQKAKSLDSDITKGAFYFVNDSKNMVMHISDWMVAIAEHYKTNFSLEECPDLISHFASIWSAIYKNEWLKENDIKLDESIRPYEDNPFVALVYSKAKTISVIPDGVYYYRQDAQNSSTNTKTKKTLNYIPQRSKNRDILIKNDCFNEDIKEKYWSVAYGGSKFFYNQTNDIYKKEYFYRMKELFKKAKTDNCKFKYFSKRDKKDFQKVLSLPFMIYRMPYYLRRIFSINNEYSGGMKHKVITILGIKIKIRKGKRNAKS